MSLLRIVIVDDEKRVRSSLSNIIKIHYPEAIIIAEAEDVTSAISIIQTHQPDLVLLDIKMSDGTGFDVLKSLNHLTFKVIFITAFDKYAIQGFKFSALDYLLKPVIPQELVAALNKAKNILQQETFNVKFNTFIENMGPTNNNKESKKIALNTQESLHIVSISDIILCEADGNYTRFVLKNNKVILVSGSLVEYSDMLKDYGFFRSHNSHLVNLSFVEKFDKRDGGKLIMKDNSVAPVSVRKKDELLKVLNSL